MSRTYKYYLQDIATSICRINQYTSGLDQTSFTQDQMRFDAVLFNFIIIGEAVKNIPAEIQIQHPEIDWRDMARFRDVLAHHYFDIERGIVWGAIREDIPVLRDQIEALLNTLTDD